MFGKELDKAKKEFGVGGGHFFRLQEGKNRVRVLAGGTVIADHFVDGKGITCFGVDNGCPYHGEGAPKDKDGNPKKARVRFGFYVLDKTQPSPKIQFTTFPYSVVKALDVLAEDDDYKFEELPMPYDIKIDYNSKEAPADMYKVLATPNKEPVSQDILDELAKQKPVEEVIEGMKARGKNEVLGVGETTTIVKDANEEYADVAEGEVQLDDDDIKVEDVPF